MAEALNTLLFALTGLQGLVMVLDELIFHRRRGLGRFERWGHVVDTSVFFGALLIPALASFEQPYILAYCVMAGLSTLVITKDEAIHSRSCGAAEHWCHSLLFILHGAILLLVGLLWHLKPDAFLLQALPILVFCWGVYQHFYWNIYERDNLGTGTGR